MASVVLLGNGRRHRWEWQRRRDGSRNQRRDRGVTLRCASTPNADTLTDASPLGCSPGPSRQSCHVSNGATVLPDGGVAKLSRPSARRSRFRRRTMTGSRSFFPSTGTPRVKRAGSRISRSALKLLLWPLCGVALKKRRLSTGHFLRSQERASRRNPGGHSRGSRDSPSQGGAPGCSKPSE